MSVSQQVKSKEAWVCSVFFSAVTGRVRLRPSRAGLLDRQTRLGSGESQGGGEDRCVV